MNPWKILTRDGKIKLVILCYILLGAWVGCVFLGALTQSYWAFNITYGIFTSLWLISIFELYRKETK